MEEFQHQWPLDIDRFTNNYYQSSLSFAKGHNFQRDKQFDSLESPTPHSDRVSKPNLNICEVNAFLPFNKEDDFSLDSTDDIKIEEQEHKIQYFQNQGNHTEEELITEPNYFCGGQDYQLECYKINRSRGPSFNLTNEKGGEAFFSKNFDLVRFLPTNNFMDPDLEPMQETVKCEYEEHFTDQAYRQNLPEMYVAKLLTSQGSDRNIKDNSTQEASEEVAADESTLQLSVPGSDHSHENPFQNASSLDTEPAPALKKKRKTNSNQAVVETGTQKIQVRRAPKLKKSKSENVDKNTIYSITPKGNSLSLKIIKLSESKEAEVLPNIRIKKQLSKTSTTDVPMEKIKIEDVQTTSDKPTEATLNSQNNIKIENTPGLVRSKSSNILSTLFQGKKPGSFSDLVAGLGLPAEVEELLNNSKIFNNLQLSTTRKIGTLTVEERKAKVEKYLLKRKQRTWSKKINYDCRKRVADSRLRFKGRFVTKAQAFAMLEEEGIHPDPNKITDVEIKNLLEEKFGSDPIKKKEKDGDGRKNNGRSKKQFKLDDDIKLKEEDDDNWLSRFRTDDVKSGTNSFTEDF